MLQTGEIEHLRSWLVVIEKHYTAYHNHKETSAWLAIAAYMVFIVGLANAGFHVTDNRVLLAAFTALVGATATGFLIFVRRQMGLRRTGGLMTTTADVLLTKLLTESFRATLTQCHLEGDRIPEDEGHNFWRLPRVRYQKPDGIWPKIFREEFLVSSKNKEGDESRLLLELIPTLLIVSGMIAYVIALWLHYFGVK